MEKQSSWDGKTRGGLTGYKIFHFILETFGVSFAYFILYFVSFYFLLFGGKSTISSYTYFRKRLGLNPFKSVVNVYQCYYNFGQTILDKVAVLSKRDHPFTSNSNGAQHLWKLAEEKKGGILISAHLGNWEIAGHFINKLNVPINIVLFDGEHQQIKAMLNKVMVKKKTNIITIKQDYSHLFEINRALRAGELICIHGDRFSDPVKSKKMLLPFLGQDAYFPVGPFSLVTRLKVPYCFVFAVKTNKYHYEFFAIEGNGSNKTEKEVMKDYIQNLEKMILKYPKQWYNFYPFWNETETKQLN